MSRFTGDYEGRCRACEEYVEFAVGIRPGSEPVAMHFGPSGAEPVPVQNVDLVVMVEDMLDLKFEFQCPLCGAWSPARTTCRARSDP